MLRQADPVYDGPPLIASALASHGSIVHTERGPMPAGLVTPMRCTFAAVRVLLSLDAERGRIFAGRMLPDVRR